MLSIEQCIMFRSLGLVWKAINGRCPIYIKPKTLLKSVEEPRTRLQKELIIQTTTTNSPYHDRKWTHNCCLFNKLPQILKMQTDFRRFKTDLYKLIASSQGWIKCTEKPGFVRFVQVYPINALFIIIVTNAIWICQCHNISLYQIN